RHGAAGRDLVRETLYAITVVGDEVTLFINDEIASAGGKFFAIGVFHYEKSVGTVDVKIGFDAGVLITAARKIVFDRSGLHARADLQFAARFGPALQRLAE